MNTRNTPILGTPVASTSRAARSDFVTTDTRRRSAPLYSRATIGGHPLHAMLVAFPVALYTSSFATFCVYLATRDPFWWKTALIANAAGVVMALVAAVPGFIDWARGIPKDTAAKKTGAQHMVLNLSALAFFAANLFVQRHTFGAYTEETGAPIAAALLTGAGLAITLAAGWLGWRLVQTHHVGIKMSDAQLRHETTPGGAFS
jgi:uncharacterized membrane protein